MSTSAIQAAQKNVARYGLSTLLIFGNVGNIFTIIILTRGAKRQPNSCSLYLLSACISNWVVINTALISNIVGVDNIDPQHTSNVICKLRWSGTHALLMLSRSFSKFSLFIVQAQWKRCIALNVCSDCCLHRSMGSLFPESVHSFILTTPDGCTCDHPFDRCLGHYSSSFGDLLQQCYGSMHCTTRHLCFYLCDLFGSSDWNTSVIIYDRLQCPCLA